MPKKIPMRRCVATGEQLPKKELLRIVRTTEGNLEIDTTGKANGRGAYLKKDISAVDTAKKNKALERSLEVKIPDEFYDTIKSYIK